MFPATGSGLIISLTTLKTLSPGMFSVLSVTFWFATCGVYEYGYVGTGSLGSGV